MRVCKDPRWMVHLVAKARSASDLEVLTVAIIGDRRLFRVAADANILTTGG